jgi:hypothetical protein
METVKKSGKTPIYGFCEDVFGSLSFEKIRINVLISIGNIEKPEQKR